MGKSFWMKDQQGNFSNGKDDTFDISKHYTGIRLQQGVPLLDRDWNELEDIRRYEEMILRKYYIGNGSPDDGFKISQVVNNPKDIKISDGRCLVEGFEAVNDFKAVNGSDLLYSGQVDPLTKTPLPVEVLPNLTTPNPGIRRSDTVYIDLWITEIMGIDALKNVQDVNMETCLRHMLRWIVKVDEGSSGHTPEDIFHHYYDIAVIQRNGPNIESITDLRKRPLINALTVNSDNNILAKDKVRVGIGTLKPEALLHVAGNVKLVGDVTIDGTLNGNPAHPPTGSDIRLKTNIEPLINVLDKLEKINGVSFEWNDLAASHGCSTGRREIGLIAQEVEAVYPELVNTWGEEKYKGVEYNKLIGVLVEAIKELKTELGGIKERLGALEEK